MAADTHSNYAFDAFQTQLKTLCLNEFPCGPGQWRETVPSTAPKNVKSNSKVESQFSITLKDFGANHEKTETLQEYVGSAKSPWSLDYSWSQEAKPLRELAVKSPWLIDDNFVLSYFKTLRIVNKNVTEIDENLMRFKNLEELTLSCNLISRINSNNLPDNLKVLEVCANQVSDLSALCEKPPRLIHLGLGYNKLNVLGDYLTAQYWPQLLSLDLSNNNLSDILDVVQKLSTLPKMRNLVLQGNPLSLIPGYRGYTVDCLRKLSVLDDIMISADERHYFKGLARRREHILDEAKVKLTVTYIKGLPMPEELKNPEEQPEFPVIERKYFVQFMFLEDSTLRTFADHVGHDDSQEMAELSGLKSERTEHSDIGDTELSGVEQVEKSVVFTEAPDILHTIDHRAQVAPSVLSDIEEKKKEEEEDKAGEPKKIKVSPVDSAKLSWAEELECNWTKAVVRDDLLALRDFFKQGMQIAVMEEVTLSYPIIQEETEDGSVPNTKEERLQVEGYPFDASTPVQGVAKGTKKDKKEKKDEKRKSSGKEKGDDKKKKKEPQQEMKRNPPTYTTLATWHVPLAEFLEGEYSYQGVFSKGNIEIASTVKTMDIDQGRKVLKSRGSGRGSSRNSKKDTSTSSRRTSWAGLADLDAKKGDAKDKNKKPTSAGKKKEDPKDKSKERKGSAAKGGKADAKGDKSGKGAKGGVAAPDDEEDPGPPPPLEIHIQVDLHHWKTAMDLLKDEEERNKPPTEEQKEM
ncbi:leucine-rich repeat-containing protein 43-like isoform X3 [Dreissena polymorpha]|uniref:leucine-rich repeat-containing protein 43-like isoform X3 n=1 Tax=Dreissena polymorpha TaxID=45954 RepID=UPI0022642194|nr:leucine-rich repeat-containing protein 43-like isoform X3 [Dreissena polymorpha]